MATRVVRGALCIVGTALLLLSFTERLGTAQGNRSLEERVAILELKVGRLEAANMKLKGRTEGGAKRTVALKRWKVLANWRNGMSLGMTKDAVRELMGEPDKIERYSTIGETWHYGYPGGGTVSFSSAGEVDHWSEPAPDDLR